MEYVARCIFCGSADQVSVANMNGLDDSKNENSFRFVQCPVCGLMYLSPRPEEDKIHEYYLPDYHPFAMAIEDDISFISRKLRQYDQYKRCRAIYRHARIPGKILDIGCSTGLFLHSIQNRGWTTFGVEPSEYAANYARNRFGLNVQKTVLEAAKYDSNFFDVVTLWDVFEHLYDPVHTLVEIYRILNPGGILLLNLPNPDSWERKWFGSSWAGWDIPRHLFLFPLHTLDRFLNNAKLQRFDLYSFTGRHGAMILSLREWLSHRQWSESRKRVILRVVGSLPAQIMTYPFYNILNWINKSSYMAVYARKVE